MATIPITVGIPEVTGLAPTLESLASSIASKADAQTVFDDLADLGEDVASKAPADHGHAIADIDGLQEALDAKAPAIVQDIEPSDFGPVLQALLEDSLLSTKQGMRRLPSFPRTMLTPVHLPIMTYASGKRVGLIGDGHPIHVRLDEAHAGDPAIKVEIVVDPTYCDLRYFTLIGVSLYGGGHPHNGAGIVLGSESGTDNFYNATIEHVIVEGMIGDGLELHGAFFESSVNHYFAHGNKGTGLTVHHGDLGGVISTIRVNTSWFRKNRRGIGSVDWARGLWIRDCDFIENKFEGVHCPNGVEIIRDCTFENNGIDAALDQGIGALVHNSGKIENCQFISNRNQLWGVDAYLIGTVKLRDCRAAYTSGGRTIVPKLAQYRNGGVNGRLKVIDCKGEVVGPPELLTILDG